MEQEALTPDGSDNEMPVLEQQCAKVKQEPVMVPSSADDFLRGIGLANGSSAKETTTFSNSFASTSGEKQNRKRKFVQADHSFSASATKTFPSFLHSFLPGTSGMVNKSLEPQSSATTLRRLLPAPFLRPITKTQANGPKQRLFSFAQRTTLPPLRPKPPVITATPIVNNRFSLVPSNFTTPTTTANDIIKKAKQTGENASAVAIIQFVEDQLRFHDSGVEEPGTSNASSTNVNPSSSLSSRLHHVEPSTEQPEVPIGHTTIPSIASKHPVSSSVSVSEPGPSRPVKVEEAEDDEQSDPGRSPEPPLNLVKLLSETIASISVLVPEKAEPAEPEEYHCEWGNCKVVFPEQKDLVEHVTKSHIQASRTFCCRWRNCDRKEAFKAQYMLVTHVRRHTGEKPNVCSVPGCGKAYSRQEYLTNHMRTHTGERPYKCDFCAKAFGSASDRAKHQNRTHSDTKHYRCAYVDCTKSYTDPSGLRKHIKTAHGPGATSVLL